MTTTATARTDSLPRPSSTRLVGPDVTRTVALIGVVVMNYHGYLNGRRAASVPGSSFVHRLFDPYGGVLSTRFAATFMLVAGVGVTLLAARSRTSGDKVAISIDRWRLARRGLLLYAGGFVLNWVWSGTILFFYGMAFMLAALAFTLRTRWLIVIAVAVPLAAAGLRWWVVARTVNGHSVAWLTSPQTLTSRSPRGLVFDTFVNGTHPMLPWFAFMCLGMIVGRTLGSVNPLRWAAIGGVATASTYLINHLATAGRASDRVFVAVLSTRPSDRGLLYTIGTAGTALVAYGLITSAAEKWRSTQPVLLLARAGQMTLTVYVLHVLVFNLFVHWLHWIGGTGLDTALLFAAMFWVLAIMIASWWRGLIGIGPLERLYRKFGG